MDVEVRPGPPADEPAGEPSNETLTEAARRGDPGAFVALMRRNNQRLYRIAYAILRDPAEAEDVVQETYVRGYAKLDSLADPAAVGGWFARIAANEALDRYRRRRRHPTVSLSVGRPSAEAAMPADLSLASSAPDPERSAASRELRPLLEAAIDALPDSFRTVFVLRAVERMSVADTADCLGIGRATVKTRFFRARRLLRRALADHVGGAWVEAYPFLGDRCDGIVASVCRRLGWDGGGSVGGTASPPRHPLAAPS